MKLILTSLLLFLTSFGFSQTQKCEFIIPNTVKNVNGLYPVEIVSSCPIQKVEITVFNRWGNEIYIANTLKHYWKGQKTPDGVYFMVISGEYYGTGEKFNSTGYVNFFN